VNRALRAGPDELVIGLLSVSDRASAGQYADEGLPALRSWLGAALKSPWQAHERMSARASRPRWWSWSTRSAATWC
jgi:molybdopterin adenylyltransferase